MLRDVIDAAVSQASHLKADNQPVPEELERAVEYKEKRKEQNRINMYVLPLVHTKAVVFNHLHSRRNNRSRKKALKMETQQVHRPSTPSTSMNVLLAGPSSAHLGTELRSGRSPPTPATDLSHRSFMSPLSVMPFVQTNHGFEDSNIDPILLNVSREHMTSPNTAVENPVAPHTPAFTHKAVDTQDLRSYRETAVGCEQTDNPSAPSTPIDLTSFEGFSYPEDSPTVLWPGGRFKTKLPCIMRGKKNILKKEAKHVEAIARQATLDSSYLEYHAYNVFNHDGETAAAVINGLQNNRTVVIRGYPYKHVPVEANALKDHFRFQEDLSVVASNAATRLKIKRNPHKVMSLAHFCQGTKDNGRIQCVLDMPAIEQHRPSFMSFLDDGIISHQNLHNYSGRTIIPLDVLKASSWVLFHQGLYHTFAHHDADGFCTWTQILSGKKFWVILHPKRLKSATNGNDIYGANMLYSSDKLSEDGYYGEATEMAIIYGEPGDIIIMPPGTFHEVYTPCPSVTIGGHFYSYHTLHLTELSRLILRQSKGGLTNADHRSAGLTIALMMACLPFMKKYRKETC